MTQRMVGDTYPPLNFVDHYGDPIDLHGCSVTMQFIPDSRRAKRLTYELKIADASAGLVEVPKPRTTGRGYLKVEHPNGIVESIQQWCQWIR